MHCFQVRKSRADHETGKLDQLHASGHHHGQGKTVFGFLVARRRVVDLRALLAEIQGMAAEADKIMPLLPRILSSIDLMLPGDHI